MWRFFANERDNHFILDQQWIIRSIHSLLTVFFAIGQLLRDSRHCLECWQLRSGKEGKWNEWWFFWRSDFHRECIEGWFISNHCSLFQDKVSFFIIILLMFFSVSFQACFWPEKKMHTDYLMFLDYVFTFVKEGKLHLAHPVLENSPKNSYKFLKKNIDVLSTLFPLSMLSYRWFIHLK